MNRLAKARLLFTLLLFFSAEISFAQTDTVIHKIYDRPFVAQLGKYTAVGGYFEANLNYFVEEGITEGLSLEARRFNVFLYSSISHHIRFFSELEFEHGTEEIALETAVLDITLDPLLNFRMGVLLSPLGQFNIEHDSPKYNFVDRPLVCTQIIPATLSEVGLGFFGGRYLLPKHHLGYEIYLVNGLTDGIIDNEETGTRIAHGKSEEMFEEDNNGAPSFVGRITHKNSFIGRHGISFYNGIYNTFKMEGLGVDEKRSLQILALDFDNTLNRLHLRGEAAVARIEIPDSLAGLYGTRQWGFYGEVNYTYFERKFFDLDKVKMIISLRLEKIDLNVSVFQSPEVISGKRIGDEVLRVSVAHSLRPSENTVIKMVYQYNWNTDFSYNLIREAGIQIGVATYF